MIIVLKIWAAILLLYLIGCIIFVVWEPHIIKTPPPPKKQRTMKIEKEVIQEWKRFMESPEYNHNPECGTLLIAQHFAEWGREHPTPPSDGDGC